MVGSLIVAELTSTAIAAFSTAQTIAAFAINFAVSQIVSRTFADNPENQQDMGVRQQVPPSSVNALPIAYGDAYMGGTFVDAVLSNDQQTMFDVLAVSSISPNGQFSFDCSQTYYGDRLATFAASGSVLSAVVFNGGTGYAVGNVLTVSGGSPTTAAQLTVTSVSGGVITGVSVSTAGSYPYGGNPYNCASVSGGSGTGATFILKFSDYGPTIIALTDESGNVDTKIADRARLQVHMYTSDQAGNVTRVNTASYPWDVMGPSEPSGIPTELQWISGAYDGVNPSRRMNGTAFAIVRIAYNQDAGTSSLSPITFHVSQYLNGTGVAKAGDVWYDYITNTVYGGAVDPDFVNTSSATFLNTYGDQTITFTNSSGVTTTQPRYRINGVLDAGQSVLSNIDRIMSACDSWMTYNSALGQWAVVVNKAESVAYAFDDNNIIGDIRVSATDITSSINQVEARFPFKQNKDQASFVNIETPPELLYPNEPVNKYSITYDLVNDSVQAQYLANRLLEQAREDLIVSFSTTFYGIQVDAGNVISVTNSDYGWTAKPFRVMKVNEVALGDGTLGAKLELSEYNSAVYDDKDITQFTPVPNSNLPSANYFSPLSAPVVSSSTSTSAIPNFAVTTTIPAIGRVTYVNLYYTTSATPTATDWKLLSAENLVDGNAYTPGSSLIFNNQVLATGTTTTATYYFCYIVGNENTKSLQSPTSASFTWNPVTGSNGTRTAILDMYQWSATEPTTFPSGVSVYTWATGQFTEPATPNGWSLTPPTSTAGQTLWIARTIYVDTATTATSNVTWTATSAYAVGAAGDNGSRTAFLELYRWAASTPTTFPSGNSTYTWATGAFTAPTTPNGWSLTPPAAVTGYTLYACSVRYVDSLTTPTSTVAWTTSTAYAVGAAGTNGTNGTDGAPGLNGLSFINAYLVQSQSASTPTFSSVTSGATIPSGWTATAPSVSVGQVMWYIQGRYNSTSSTIDGVAANTTAWTGPIAASIFQDIRSDNWNGSTPPTASNVATWGTTGYYISRTDGNMYANGFYARGKMIIDGSNGDLLNTALKANQNGTADIGVYGYGGGTTAGRGVAGVAGGTSGVGVVGSATASPARAGVLAFATGGATTAFEGAGGVWKTDNSTLVTNLNAQYLNGIPSTGFYAVGGALGTPSSGTLTNCTFPTLNQNTTGNAATATNASQLGGYSAGNSSGNIPISNGSVNTNLNADLLDGQNASAFVNVAGGTDNGKYIYYVNNTGAPSNPTTRAAWILISTNDGGTVYIPGYI